MQTLYAPRYDFRIGTGGPAPRRTPARPAQPARSPDPQTPRRPSQPSRKPRIIPVPERQPDDPGPQRQPSTPQL